LKAPRTGPELARGSFQVTPGLTGLCPRFCEVGMKSLIKSLSLVFCSFLSCSLLAAEAADECLNDLNYLPDFLLKNDAGARDRLSQVGSGFLADALAKAREDAADARTERACN